MKNSINIREFWRYIRNRNCKFCYNTTLHCGNFVFCPKKDMEAYNTQITLLLCKRKSPAVERDFVSGIRVSGMGISPCRLRRLHNKGAVCHHLDVVHGRGIKGNNISQLAGFDGTDLLIHLHHFSVDAGGSLEKYSVVKPAFFISSNSKACSPCRLKGVPVSVPKPILTPFAMHFFRFS